MIWSWRRYLRGWGPPRVSARGGFFHPLGDACGPSARVATSRQNSLGRGPRRTLKRSVRELQREKWLLVWKLADAKPPPSPDEHDFERPALARELVRPRARPVRKPRIKPERRSKLTDLRLHHPHSATTQRSGVVSSNLSERGNFPRRRRKVDRCVSSANSWDAGAAAAAFGHIRQNTSATSSPARRNVARAGSPIAATRARKPRPCRASSSARFAIQSGSASP